MNFRTFSTISAPTSLQSVAAVGDFFIFRTLRYRAHHARARITTFLLSLTYATNNRKLKKMKKVPCAAYVSGFPHLFMVGKVEKLS